MAYTNSSNFAKMFCAKSPFNRALVGNQKNLPENIKDEIKAAPPFNFASDAQRKAAYASGYKGKNK